MDLKAAMAHGEDFGCLALYAVDHAIVADDDLPDVGAVEFADDGTRFGEFVERFNGGIDAVSPVDNRRPVLAFLGNIPHEFGGDRPHETLVFRPSTGSPRVPSLVIPGAKIYKARWVK